MDFNEYTRTQGFLPGRKAKFVSGGNSFLDLIQNIAQTSSWIKTQSNKPFTYALITAGYILLIYNIFVIQFDKQNAWRGAIADF